MLESLVSIRPSQAKSSGSNSIKLDSHSADLIERFHKESLNYKHMLSFSRMTDKSLFSCVVEICGILSFCWKNQGVLVEIQHSLFNIQ